MNDGKYFFTTPATIKSSSSKKFKTYEVTGYSIEVDEKGHPTQNGFDQTASLMKLYCDTDYESARYLFIDKNGKIIRHLAYSNGVPNSTRPYPGEKELNEIRSYAQKNDCSIVFLHNHPNGYVEPSRADIEMTERMESLLADNSGTRRFAGHIILDTGSYTYGFYDSNFKNWEIRYNGQEHSFDEYYNAIKSGNLKIRHDTDPDRKTIFFRIEDDRTPKFLSETEKAYSKDEWNKDEWIPLFYLKEYGVLEHLEYIHKNSFKDYESLDKRIRDTATKTGTTRCFMLPKNYELTVECSRYASKKEQGKDKGIIESVYFANGSDSILKRYKHSIFDGYNTNRMKIIDDSLDFPFGINMRENITKEKDIKSENIITADILQMIASKTTIWGISQQKAENLIDYLTENKISLYYDPDSLNISASGSLSGTQLENKEIITLKDIESFYSNKSVQFQTLKGEPNMKENIEKESVRQNDAGLKASSISETGSSEMDYRVALAHEIKINMPNLSDGERAAAISILEAGAVSVDMKLSDYVKQTFPNGIFGNFQEAELSARQQGKLINGGVVIDGFGENAKAVIYASRTADFSTWVHEVAHIWQAQLTGKLKQNAQKAVNYENGLTSKDLSDFLAMSVKDLMQGKEITQKHDINDLNQKEIKETVSERIARWDYDYDDGDQSWPQYSEVYFDKNNNEFILKDYEGYNDTWDERKITPEELLEKYNDAKRLNGYKNHKIIQELNENFVKSFITQEKQNIPSISDVEKEVVSDPEPSSHSDEKISDELKFTKTPEFEKPAEDIQVEDFDSSSSKTDPEKEEPVINIRQLSYSVFLIEASKLETPEAYEKFFNENFNFQIANFKPIPPIADNKLQLFIDGKATDKVFNDNIEEKRSWARWCFDKGMAMYVPLPEVVKKNGMDVIKKSISICNNLLNTDITREAEAKEQSQEAAEQKKDNEPGASIIGPQLYAGSEWTEEELKLIRHVEIDKIPAFIKDPYMDDIAVPKFTTAFRDPETGEYTMKEQSGWHFAQKMTEHGAVTAIMLTKINDSGVREFLKIEPTQYEAIINRGKELVQEWSEPRFKNTHLQALYKYENDIGISKHETRTNTCGQYFHNFEALCRGSSDGRSPADNEEQAMKYAKEIYMKMSPHEKRRMHKMEKEFLKAKGYTIEEEIMRRFYEVQKERVFSQNELELPGHSEESLVNGISVEEGKIRGELDDVSHTKVGDTVRISLTTKNFNGKELRMPVTDMKVVAANKETNTVCLIDEQKNTRYELPLDKFISHRQEVTRKLNMQQQKDNRQAAKIEARQKKKETEDYSFGI